MAAYECSTDRHRAHRTRSVTLVWALILASVAVALVGGATPAGAAGGEFVSVATFGGTNSDQCLAGDSPHRGDVGAAFAAAEGLGSWRQDLAGALLFIAGDARDATGSFLADLGVCVVGNVRFVSSE